MNLDLHPSLYEPRTLDKQSTSRIKSLLPIPNYHASYLNSYLDNGWTVIIKKKSVKTGFSVFLSEDAYVKYNFYKHNPTMDSIKFQQNGFGVPLLKLNSIKEDIFPYYYLSFKRYFPTNFWPFDENKDFYEFCKVSKTTHIGYTCFVFEFTPDPTDPGLDFKVFMFSHSRLPISDYIYKGERRRWIEQTLLDEFKKQGVMRYGFKNTVLKSNQVSLTDNWDGESKELRTKSKNPYLSGYFKKRFSWSYRLPKEEYYGESPSAILCETLKSIQPGFSGIKIIDRLTQNVDTNYESTISLSEEVLVTICIGTVLNWEKDAEIVRTQETTYHNHRSKHTKYYYSLSDLDLGE